MTKRKIDSSQHQLNLFDCIQKVEALSRQTEAPAAGTLDIDTRLRHAISDDLRHAQDAGGRLLSRNEVAARMSDLTGCEITASMLNNYTAEAHDRHRFPCQFLPAFVIATGQRRAFEALSHAAGLFALPGSEAIRAEIRKLDEEMQKLKRAKHRYEIYLEGADEKR